MPHILVVDDDPDIRDALRMTLETEGYDVRTASHGVEALAEIDRDRPALMLLDLMMPLMGGAEVLERVRGDSRFERMPVLLITAWPREAATVHGAQGVLAKPVDIHRLFDQVAKLTGGP